MNLKELKQEIIDKVDALEAFSKYIGKEVRLGKAIRSPLREGDKSPSFNIYRNSAGRVLFKDFAGQEGDIFKFVELLYNVSFSEAIKIIANDFGISQGEEYIKKKQPVRSLKIDSYYKKPKAEFKWNVKEWTDEELRYWKQYKIAPYVLNLYETNSCEYFQTGMLHVVSNEDDPIFMYHYPSGSVRFYRPLTKNKKDKQIGNANVDDVFGLQQIIEHNVVERLKYICICAGQKDVMSLYSNANPNEDVEIMGVCLNSESSHLRMDHYLKLKELSDNICIVYDNDATGRKYAQKIKDEYPDLHIVDIIKFTDRKDISDYYYSRGVLGRDLLRDEIHKTSIQTKTK